MLQRRSVFSRLVLLSCGVEFHSFTFQTWGLKTQSCLLHGNLGCFAFSRTFRFEIPETFRVKWKGFFHAGEEPCFQSQSKLQSHWQIKNIDGTRRQQMDVGISTSFWHFGQFWQENKTFCSSGNDVDFLSIAATCCFVRKLNRAQNYFESTVWRWGVCSASSKNGIFVQMER